jgi:hypothetical protein
LPIIEPLALLKLSTFIAYPGVSDVVSISPTSTAFFDIFAAGGSHEGWLDAQEHRLLAEWIDLGAQLYNDPFRVPEN